jgi:hypothetical protein
MTVRPCFISSVYQYSKHIENHYFCQDKGLYLFKFQMVIDKSIFCGTRVAAGGVQGAGYAVRGAGQWHKR